MNHIDILNNLYSNKNYSNKIYANIDNIKFYYLDGYINLDYIFYTNFDTTFSIYNIYDILSIELLFIFDTTDHIIKIDNSYITFLNNSYYHNYKKIDIKIGNNIEIIIDNTNVSNIDISNQSKYYISILPNGEFSFKINSQKINNTYNSFDELNNIELNNVFINKIKEINSNTLNNNTNIYVDNKKYYNINIDNYIISNISRIIDKNVSIINENKIFNVSTNPIPQSIANKIYDSTSDDIEIILYNEDIIK